MISSGASLQAGQWLCVWAIMFHHGNQLYQESRHDPCWVPCCSYCLSMACQRSPNSVLCFFADDSKIIGNAHSPDVIQSDINRLSQWADIWQMSFSTGKCSVVHIGNDNPLNNYAMNNTQLRCSQKEKYLGLCCLLGKRCRKTIFGMELGRQRK